MQNPATINNLKAILKEIIINSNNDEVAKAILLDIKTTAIRKYNMQ